MTDLQMEGQITIEHCNKCGVTYTDACECPPPIIVDVWSQNKIVWSAEAEDEEAAKRAAQQGWDESWDPHFSRSRKITFTIDGRVVVTLESRP